MTILDVCIVDRERALIGVDSECTTPTGERGRVQKMFPLVHLSAVLSGRGDLVFIKTVASVFSQLSGDIADLLERAHLILAETFHGLVRYGRLFAVKLFDDTDAFDNQVVVIVGWSPKLGSMIGRAFRQDDRVAGFIDTEIRRNWVAPFDESLQKHRIDTHHRMVDLARAQARLFVEKAPEAAFGGKFIIADLRRDAMIITPAYDFGCVSRAPDAARVRVVV